MKTATERNVSARTDRGKTSTLVLFEILFISFVVFYVVILPFGNDLLHALNVANVPIGIRRVHILGNLSIDLIGGFIPFFVSVAFIIILLRNRGVSLSRFLFGLLFSIGVCLALSGIRPYGVLFHFSGFAFLVGALSVFLIYYRGGLADLVRKNRNSGGKWDFIFFNSIQIDKRSYLEASFLTYAYATFSVLLVDFLSMYYYSFQGYIGAMGFADAVFLSGLFGVIHLLFLTSFLEIIKMRFCPWLVVDRFCLNPESIDPTGERSERAAGQVSVPSNEYIEVVMGGSPGTTYTVYWGRGNPTNFQITYQVLS